jgi:O-antigen biosynthesis protein
MSDAVSPTLPPVLVIAGMHRSGTSLTSSLCQSAGLFVGHRMNPGLPGHDVPHYYEDIDFVGFHERTLISNGWSSAGFDITASAPQVSESAIAEARSLVAARRLLNVPWGWKDPRSVLFLDFWYREIPEAKFLFIFRKPWEVADSLFRRGDTGVRLGNEPLRALKLWHFYNERIVSFVNTHPERTLVREINQVVASPNQVFADIRSRLWIPVADPQPLYRKEFLHTTANPIQECLVAMAAPECMSLYSELQQLAGEERQTMGGDKNAVGSRSIDRALEAWARSAAPTQGGEPKMAEPSAAILPIGDDRAAGAANAIS